MRPRPSQEDDRQHLLRTRRDFIRQASCAAVGGVAIANSIRDFRLINSVLAQGGGGLTDYKALVCIFMSGGNDCNNFVVPRGADYATYQSARGNLAIPEASLHALSPFNDDGHTYGFHPSCGELATLFGENKLAIQFNVGPLLFPTTRDQYRRKLVALPPQLFSHSDQVTHWQTSLPDQPPKSGWGGRVADILHSQQPGAQISLCTSVAGSNTFEVGDMTQQYHVSTTGAVLLSGVTQNRLATMRSIIDGSQTTTPDTNLQGRAYADAMEKAIVTGQTLNTAVEPTRDTGTAPIPWTWGTPFPNTGLGNQLKMVARLIAARNQLTMKRQIFFVSVGGYDTHTAQVGNVANPSGTPNAPLFGSHANLLNELSEAIFAFQRGIEQVAGHNVLGDAALAQKVTAFTASDFGRTFPTNGQGSDHGWGSHHIVVGGAVNGRRTFGTFPLLQVNGPDDTSTGRWIPTTAVDEYSATLAKWFGVPTGSLGTVFPNLGRFVTPDVGFML
jgi:uncharacterized protein (DUF1501 family)